MSPAGRIAPPAAARPARARARGLGAIRSPRADSSPHIRARAGTLRELLACSAGLGALAVIMCAGHIRGGGFYYGDWGALELARFPPAGGALHGLWLYYGQRPGRRSRPCRWRASPTCAAARGGRPPPPSASPYGRSYWLDVRPRRAARLDAWAQCAPARAPSGPRAASVRVQ